MSKKKIIIIVVVVLVVLLAIGGAGSGNNQNSNTNQNSSTTEQTAATGASPKMSIDSMTDDLNVDSYSVDDSGVTFNFAYTSDEKNYLNCEPTYFKYGDSSSSMTYDKEQDKYFAKGITFYQDGEENKSGLITLNGGAKTTVKFTVDGFTKAQEYDGFEFHFDLKYSGASQRTIKDDNIKVHVS